MEKEDSYIIASINTLKASGWTLWAARLFGKKRVVDTPDGRVVTHSWRGLRYLTDFTPAEH